MRFLLRIRSLLLFLVLEAVALVLLVNTNNYNHYAVFSSANTVSGGMLDAVGTVSSYFGLRERNAELAEQNAALMERIRELETRLGEDIFKPYALSDSAGDTLWLDAPTAVTADRRFELISARVVSASVNKRLNYITLNKGESAGLKNNMGIICPDGAIGTVAMTSENFSLVLPIVNIQSMTSCRLDSSGCFGSLQWTGGDPRHAWLEEIPRHIKVVKGEGVRTSGFSDIYPARVPVGVVDSVSLDPARDFYKIRVKLAVDFNRLNYVQAVAFDDYGELRQLSDSIAKLQE